MAICKTDGSIISIHGKCGGVYFKKDRYGQHIQAMPRHIKNTFGGLNPIYEHSPGANRDAGIKSFSAGAWMWILIAWLIGQGIYELWKYFGGKEIYFQGDEPPKSLPGYQWFMHFNIKRLVRELPPYAYPPNAAAELPDAVSTSGFSSLNLKNWYYAGVYNNNAYFKTQQNDWYCWWFGPSWIISPKLGEAEEPPYWFRIDENPKGDYIPVEPVWKEAKLWD